MNSLSRCSVATLQKGVPLLLTLIAPAILFLPAFQGWFFSYGDASSYFLHLADLYRSAWQDGAIFWSDKIMSGYPTLGNPQVGLFYWLNIPLLFLDPFQGFRYQVVVHGYLLVLGAFLLAQHWGVNRWIASGLAIHLLCSGTMISLITMTNNWMAVAWIPWIVLSYSFLNRPLGQVFFFFGLHCFLATGEPQLAFLMFPIMAVSIMIQHGLRRSLIPILLMVLSGMTQPWLLSFVESVIRSTRQMGLVTMQDLPWVLDRALSLSIWAPSSIFRSEGWSGWMDLNGGVARPNWILSLYTGGIVLFWACRGMLERRTLVAWFLVSVMAVLAIASIGTIPGTSIAIEQIPPFDLIRYPVRYLILVHIGIFGFAGRGLAKIDHGKIGEILPASALVLAQFIVIFILFFTHPYHAHSNVSAYSLWRVIMESQIWLQVILLGLLLLAIAFQEKVRWGLIVIILISAGVGLFHSMGQIEYSSRARFDLKAEYERLDLSKGFWFVNDGNFVKVDTVKLKGSKAWIDSLTKANPEKLRRTSSGDVFSSSSMHHNGVRSWGVIIELFPRVIQGYYRFLASANGEPLTNLLWLLGVDHMLGSVSSRNGELPLPARSELVQLIAGPRDVALVWKLPPGLEIVSILDTVVSDSNYNRLLFWSASDSGALGVTEGVPCSGSSERTAKPDWVRLGPDRWQVEVEGHRGMLLLRQANYPGWKTIVDGRVMDPVSVNLLYGGVCLDGGIKQVEFRFRPRFLLPSILMVVSSLLAVPWLVFWRRGARGKA